MEFVKKFSVDPNADFKDKLMMGIEQVKMDYGDKCHYSNMSYSDYKVDYTKGRPKYHDIFLELITPHLKEYMRMWHCNDCEIGNIWFAEYHDNADFGWHTHEGVNMSAVYAVELEDNTSATQLMGRKNPMSEGELIVFPGMLPHRSPHVINGNKIVIGLNWNMFGVQYA